MGLLSVSSSAAGAEVARMLARVHVALLRGLNVGGKNRLPMGKLAAVFEAEGCTGVTTYIQSGNVVFSTERAAADLSRALSDRLLTAHSMDVPVVLRSGEELVAVARANPFLRRGADPGALHVAFLSTEPDPVGVARLDPDRAPPDELIVTGSEVYLHLPNGVGRTKLTNAYLDRCLGVVSTARNWRTVLALAEMVRG